MSIILHTFVLMLIRDIKINGEKYTGKGTWIFLSELKKYWEYEKSIGTEYGDMTWEEYLAYSKAKLPDRQIVE